MLVIPLVFNNSIFYSNVYFVAGYGASCDAHHITAPDPEGLGLKRAILACLKDAQLTPEQVQYVNAHGTSTSKNDKGETLAYKATFGDHAYKLKISSIKVLMMYNVQLSCSLSIMFFLFVLEVPIH